MPAAAIATVIVVALALGGMPAVVRAQTPASELPPGKGRELTASLCAACHTLQPILRKRDGAVGWRTTVDNMVMRGLNLFRPGEPEAIVEYLTQTFGPGSNPMQTDVLPPGAAVPQSVKSGKEVVLPNGDGRDLVELHCTLCHDLGRVVSGRRTRDDWERVTRNMIDRGSKATPEQVQRIVGYLAAQFGNRTQ